MDRKQFGLLHLQGKRCSELELCYSQPSFGIWEQDDDDDDTVSNKAPYNSKDIKHERVKEESQE